MADVATSFGVLNYSGMLFNKGNTRTPFSTMIGNKAKVTNHVEFVTGQEYTTGGGAQPSISEDASLTAPQGSFITRTQKTNVTQIFQETVGVSYGKQSNMGTLAGLNAAGQMENPVSELDFQVAARMAKIAADIEYTFIRGTYVKSTADNVANKTRGMVEAITTNVVDMNNAPLTLWDIANGVKKIRDANAPIEGLVLLVDATTYFQINSDAVQNGLTIVPADRTVNGIEISAVITPLGKVNIYLAEYLPSGTALLVDLDVIAPVHQPVPGKGNFFMEELAKVGAGVKYQIFGQLGLDHGPEWYHAKFTNIATTFTKPSYNKSVYVTGGDINTHAVTEADSPAADADADAAE